MPRDSTLSHIVKHAGFDTFGTVINYVLMFASSVIITRTIGADLFGKYSLSNSIFLILCVFAVFGLDTGVVRLASKYKARGDPQSTKGTLISGVLLSGGFGLAIMSMVIAVSPILASRIFKNVEGISWVLRIHMIALPFYAMMQVANGYTQGFKSLKYSVTVEFLTRPIVRLGIIIPLFMLGLRLQGVLYATVASYIGAAILAFYFAIRISDFHFFKTNTRRVTRELFFYSVPLVAARSMNIIMSRSNTILVGYFKDSTSTGLFSAAVTLATFIAIGLTSFGKICSPIMSDLWERRQMQELASTFKAVSKWVLTIGLPVYLVFLLFAPQLLRVFGEEFSRAGTALRLVAAGQLANVFLGLGGFLFAMTGRQKLSLLNTSILAVVSVSLNIVMIPRWGINGAGLVTAASLILISIVRGVEVKVIYGFTPLRRDLYKPIVAGAVAALAVYLLNMHLGWESLPRIFILSLAVLGIYVLCLCALGLKEEKEVILNIIGRRRHD